MSAQMRKCDSDSDSTIYKAKLTDAKEALNDFFLSQPMDLKYDYPKASSQNYPRYNKFKMIFLNH